LLCYKGLAVKPYSFTPYALQMNESGLSKSE
jgi:hypothetical protein